MKVAGQDIKKLKGLSDTEAVLRLKESGYNELPSSKKRGIINITFEVFREPMFVLLVACGTLYLILGNVGEALMLLGFVFVIIGITIYQENRTEKALDALKDLASPRALVIREGSEKRIAGREVVVDDLIIIKEGDRVPADAVLFWGMNLTSDESLLTGESVPVRKNPSENVRQEIQRPGGDDLPFIYSGSLIVQGQGVAQVLSTGINTEIGKIGKALHSIKEEKTALQKETGKIVKTVFIFAAALSLTIICIYGITRGDWLNGILSGITLAMAMLPEEFPVVLTVFLALGAWRMSKKQVLTRRIATVETLGAATVLCVDKTGTLTQNKMSIKKIFSKNEFCDIEDSSIDCLSETFHELIEYGILASKKDPFDPMEKALHELGRKALYSTEHLHKNWNILTEYPLSSELLSLSHVYKHPETGAYYVSAKGAPESIFDLCHLSLRQRDDLAVKVNIIAGAGLRVLGVAKAKFYKNELPRNQHEFEFEFLGLIGLADPLRESVPDAIKECYQAGIRVVMITGDYPATAQNIARQIGLKNIDQVITGPELAEMNPAQLKDKISAVNIFARVIPEQKLLLVNALKEKGEIVAMTGDGVNDAPALKSAHIGVAMGERGTDVARESSAIVLLKDDFASIVAAVRLGRRIFDNLKKAMAYIISVHIPIAGISLIPVLVGWPVILYPVHILFLELIIDPACSIVFEQEKEEENTMKRPPRDPVEPLFGKRLLFLSILQGLFSLVVIAAVYKVALALNQSVTEARTLSFFALIISNLCLILTNRSWSKSILSSLFVPNQALKWVILGAILFLGLVIYVPFLQKLFHFATMHCIDVIIAMIAGILSVVWFEIVKILSVKKNIELLKN